MTTFAPSDCSIGIKKETVYGTAVTVDRHLVFTAAPLQKQINYLQSEGMKVGRVGPGFSGRVPGSLTVSGDIELEADSVDTRILLEAAFGAIETGGSAPGPYFHLATCAAGGLPPSYTIQMGVPIGSSAATIASHTFTGMMCNQLKLDASNGEFVKLTSSWVGKDMDTAPAFVTPAYTADSTLLTFFSASLAIGGTVVPPTTTAKATGGTAASNVRDLTITLDNGLPDNVPVFGSGGTRLSAPPYGRRKITGQFTAEFDAVTLRDASLAGTGLALLLEVAGGTDEALQLVLPKIALDSNLPNSNKGELITQQFSFTAYEDDADLFAYALLQNTVAAA